jgi:hypothetical protein
MYVIYKKYHESVDPRHTVIDNFAGFTLVQVSNLDWINWEQGRPRIIPEDVARWYNYFGRPEFRGYQDRDTGEIHASKYQLKDPVKITRPYTEEEAAGVLEYMKTVMRVRIEDIFYQRYLELQTHINAFEMSTWPQQLKEAEEGRGILIEEIAKARGITVSVLADKIKTNAAEYHAKVGNLLGKQQRHIRDVDACSSIEEAAELADLKFGIAKYPQFGTSRYGDFVVRI